MYTTVVEINGKKIEVYGVMFVSVAVKSKIFQNFIKNMDPRFIVQSIEIQAIDFRGAPSPENVLFLKMKADVANENGRFIPGSVFMRGGAVAILLVLECEREEYTVLTRQPRFAMGDFDFPEIPAGMLDGSGDFIGIAAKELAEETGIKINKDKLIPLNPKEMGVMVPSAGGCDEFLKLFLLKEEITRDELMKLAGKCTGVAKENEYIVLDVIRLRDIPIKTPDGKALSALALYDYLLNKDEIK
ncbi:hypothetical protein A2331_03960 [Candidatus Falkowbacteria bacterium RIFOXYB2_FULL_34_18]|uniref:Uncharacterized protein n=1 Tax=Candidatus Falkowbacteria bacterium RIFOXYD2_FULL_34_120 TaxID=1798007 RepID=A0A1F5TPQ1_9BACT|nr:MAG: hypothetical protein A2331_03960 [Candidatus Falkowbacteria bacterium RIFOXYB2_FULL_34_18]OGF29106.1 MAG: hypothetical protein A2500_03285 [Candidatus Falkowbacteria bacterium RIFOXYC12_FULL_34_55]OGF36189.1 MAG: hypothetical protein A2466_04815 [Candidatus Falkowbacteria bacterium RIFOXYC2_FULL_34_220]OGF38616.1 MAG: hypothetical protein A2515_02175 [Candidatus Falkowbacteria bacterium RIFOXYD12_FULL_34_57]OGF40799.1 MAG: hypothetical protein A2531_06820 [Candidatus Falkowbacteria bact